MLICLLALVDQYRTLELIRERLKLEDNPEPIELPRDRSITPSAIGLPSSLDTQPYLVVLFLSTSCSTCRSIAEGLRAKRTQDVWVVLQQAHDTAQGTEWLGREGLPVQRSTVDLGGNVAAALNISIIPSVVLYRDGEAVLAQTIPSFRQLVPLLSPRTLPQSLKIMQEGSVRT
jgi:hypothetical protein